MRILFIGSVKFSEIILKEIKKSKFIDLVGVCTKKKSPFNSDFCDLSKFAKKNKIPFFYTNDINSKKVSKWIIARNPEYIFCIGWSQLIDIKLINLYKDKIVGYHPSNLPMNRGRHPLIWSIFLGLKKSGSTFFLINKFADKGKIISQKIISLKKKENATTLYKKICSHGKKQIKKILNDILKGNLKTLKSNLSKSNYWRRRSEEDGKIDWRMNSKNIERLVNALKNPYPGAYFIYKNKKIRVSDVKEIKKIYYNIEPGKIVDKKRLLVKTSDTLIKLIKIKPSLDFKNINYL